MDGWSSYHVIDEATGRNLAAYDYPLSGEYTPRLTGQRIVVNPDVEAVKAVCAAVASDYGYAAEPFDEATFTAALLGRRARVTIRVELEDTSETGG